MYNPDLTVMRIVFAAEMHRTATTEPCAPPTILATPVFALEPIFPRCPRVPADLLEFGCDDI
jgi:hypothetical protein